MSFAKGIGTLLILCSVAMIASLTFSFFDNNSVSAEVENFDDKYAIPNCKKIAEWVDISKQSKYNDKIEMSEYPELSLYDAAIAIYINRKMPSSRTNTYASAFINCRAILAGNVRVQPDES